MIRVNVNVLTMCIQGRERNEPGYRVLFNADKPYCPKDKYPTMKRQTLSKSSITGYNWVVKEGEGCGRHRR
jgi:hypothetical protein